ncbi:DUF2358 domain-containing protein [[Limnothrix rosea] IAM M-220]|uniref:DUF2358 domain-containing protein n=1 Tax=[Limnothrix rosea] IAM M-220 TaxID=454133 RepID=UPI00095C865A|nr:DUF2358 domain-containing protein [[Limnothrix rosea] IAM M-220]OKH15165.1 hypothetical protein NIES208_12870 [[Limnothrix rosea] IAM M-220]
MDILEILQQDYQRFPKHQSFEIYARNVFFKDPLNEFRGVHRYKKMIGFLGRWFRNVDLDLHQIHRNGTTIRTDWTLKMTCPLPWQPRLSISGYSLLEVNERDLIISHIDYWYDAPLKVLGQVFRFR